MARKKRTTAEITVEIYFAINQLGGGKRNEKSAYIAVSASPKKEGVSLYNKFNLGDNLPLFDVFAVTNTHIDVNFGTTERAKSKTRRNVCAVWPEDEAFPDDCVKYKVAVIPHAILQQRR